MRNGEALFFLKLAPNHGKRCGELPKAMPCNILQLKIVLPWLLEKLGVRCDFKSWSNTHSQAHSQHIYCLHISQICMFLLWFCVRNHYCDNFCQNQRIYGYTRLFKSLHLEDDDDEKRWGALFFFETGSKPWKEMWWTTKSDALQYLELKVVLSWLPVKLGARYDFKSQSDTHSQAHSQHIYFTSRRW